MRIHRLVAIAVAVALVVAGCTPNPDAPGDRATTTEEVTETATEEVTETETETTTEQATETATETSSEADGDGSAEGEPASGAGGVGSPIGELEIDGDPVAIQSLCLDGGTIRLGHSIESAFEVRSYDSPQDAQVTVFTNGPGDIRSSETRTDFGADGLRSYFALFAEAEALDTIALTIPAEPPSCASGGLRRIPMIVTVERLDGATEEQTGAGCLLPGDRLRVEYAGEQLGIELGQDPPVMDLGDRTVEELATPAERTDEMDGTATFSAEYSPDLTGGITGVTVSSYTAFDELRAC